MSAKRSARLDKAMLRLSDLVEGGHLMAATDPAALFDAACDELTELRRARDAILYEAPDLEARRAEALRDLDTTLDAVIQGCEYVAQGLTEAARLVRAIGGES